ncbi:hypothetical protein D3C72_1107830 [compost metagenome]
MLEKTVQFVEVCQQIFCPLVIDHAVLRKADAARRAVQKLSTEQVLQRLNLARYATFRKTQRVRGARKTLQFRHADEKLHCVNFIHRLRSLLLLMKQ